MTERQSAQLREQKAAYLQQMQMLLDASEKENRNFHDAERAQYDDLKKKVRDLSERITRADETEREILRQVADKGHLIGNDPTDPVEPTDGTAYRTKSGEMIPTYTTGQRMNPKPAGATFGSFAMAIATGEARNEIEKRALVAGSGSGAKTVPEELFGEVFDKLREDNVLEQLGARFFKFDHPSKFVSITSDPAVTWRVENDPLADDDPVFGHKAFTPHWATVLVKVSNELLHSSLNLEQALEKSLLGAARDAMVSAVINGTGANGQPAGMNVWSGIGTIDIEAAFVTNYDLFLQAQYFLRQQNAKMNGVLLSPRSERDLNRMKAIDNQPLVKPASLQDVLFLSSNQVRDNFDTDKSKVYCGQWDQLSIGIFRDFKVEILKEAFISNFQTGFLLSFAIDLAPTNEASFVRIDNVSEHLGLPEILTDPEEE